MPRRFGVVSPFACCSSSSVVNFSSDVPFWGASACLLGARLRQLFILALLSRFLVVSPFVSCSTSAVVNFSSAVPFGGCQPVCLLLVFGCC